jgi:periplasmic divalent cation tolerance protein
VVNDPRTVVALVTAPSADAADISKQLVEARLSACVNIVPTIQSVYMWDGELKKDEESLLVVKTRQDLIVAVGELLDRIHPYEIYELVVLAIVGGNQRYLDWIGESVGPGA